MSIGFRIVPDQRFVKIVAALKEAPQKLMAMWERSVRAELEKGVGYLQINFRSGGAGNVTTPTQTKVVTGNLRASYSEDTRREGRAIRGEIGILRKSVRGKVLVYAPVHEFGAIISRRKGRTLKRPIRIGARPGIAPTVARVQPILLARLQQDAATVLSAA